MSSSRRTSCACRSRHGAEHTYPSLSSVHADGKLGTHMRYRLRDWTVNPLRVSSQRPRIRCKSPLASDWDVWHEHRSAGST
jgi:hypothetical protein